MNVLAPYFFRVFLCSLKTVSSIIMQDLCLCDGRHEKRIEQIFGTVSYHFSFIVEGRVGGVGGGGREKGGRRRKWQ